jgi:amidase
MPSINDSDLCYLSVEGALQMFASGRLAPRELMEAIAQRIAAVNPGINAFGDLFLDDALARSRGAETRWQNGTARPLEGIPVAVKDAQRVAGQRTTFGSPVYKENVAMDSDPMIERLLEAGAIIHGRTTVSEFCASGICKSPMWGITRNPWNPAFSPGGSSGGSGAALAAGMTLLATGTDMGGSIRVPASACGVVGYKPPHGRNPDGPPFNVDRFSHCGVLARSVVDIALVQGIISGQHPADPDSLADKAVYPSSPTEITGCRVAWSPNLSYRAIEPEVRAETMRAVEVFRSLGCDVEEVDLGWNEEIDEITIDWFRASEVGQMIATAARDHPGLVSVDFRRLALQSAGARQGIAHVFELIDHMSRSFAAAMDGRDFFLCPTMTIAAVPADQSIWDTAFEIDGKKVDPEFGYSTTHQFNLLSSCPVMSVPSGRTRNGIPTGLQIVGKPFDEASVFRAAFAFEVAEGGWYSSSNTRPQL